MDDDELECLSRIKIASASSNRRSQLCCWPWRLAPAVCLLWVPVTSSGRLTRKAASLLVCGIVTTIDCKFL